MGTCFETGKAQEWAAGLRKSPRPASQTRGDFICGTTTQPVAYPAGGWDNRTACPQSFNSFRSSGQAPGTKNRRYSAPQRRRWDQHEPALQERRAWDDRTACSGGFGRFTDRLGSTQKIGGSRPRLRPETEVATAQAKRSVIDDASKHRRPAEETPVAVGTPEVEAPARETVEAAAEGLGMVKEVAAASGAAEPAAASAAATAAPASAVAAADNADAGSGEEATVTAGEAEFDTVAAAAEGEAAAAVESSTGSTNGEVDVSAGASTQGINDNSFPLSATF